MCFCHFTRRGFMATALAAPATLQASCASVETWTEPGSRWLDVHCHVFNGSDLPMYEFITRVVFRKQPLPLIAKIAIATLAAGLKHDSPDPGSECRELGATDCPASRGWLAFDRLRVQMQLQERIGPNPSREEPSDSLLSGLQRVQRRSLGTPRDRQDLALLPMAQIEGLEQRQRPERDRDGLALMDAALRAYDIRRTARPSVPASEPELRALDARLRAEPPRSEVARYIAWGNLFGQSRADLVQRLVRLYPARAEVALAPSIVDYDAWIGAPETAPAAQAKVMFALARKSARQGRAPIMPFIAFDPWRALKAEAQGQDPLDLVRTAVEREGAIGVKLYPPMGFRPTGNADAPEPPFDDGFRAFIRSRPCGRPGLAPCGETPGQALDRVMASLFAWCTSAQVPVMAHCAPTNNASDASQDFSNPGFWERVLRANRTLRLNFGHFGGLWDVRAGTNLAWMEHILRLIANADYPHVYADMSYCEPVLYDDADRRAALLALRDLLRGAMAQGGTRLRRRVMFGTDWSMVGREANAGGYPGLLMTAVQDLWPGESGEDFRWRNAARFIGLEHDGEARKRLLASVWRGLPTGPLDRFMPAS